MTTSLSAYEREKAENIARNKQMLLSLGLEKPSFEPKEKELKSKSKSPKKRALDTEDALEQPGTKITRLDVDAVLTDGVRRSRRNLGKSVDYKGEREVTSPVPISIKSGVRLTENTGPLGRDGGKRIHNPKTFGSIPGIKVGTWWETRMACSADAVHAPWVAGISPSPLGAFSVALSGGYSDDVDLGYAFTYTGSGGRDLKGTKSAPKNLRTAPQSCDQTFDNRFNSALKKSADTRKPIRVIRGYKLRSPYAPSEGYRYDGLYIVERAWIEKGLEGFMVCKFAFRRLPGQPPLLIRLDTSEDA